jgi:hypothetical protein
MRLNGAINVLRCLLNNFYVPSNSPNQQLCLLSVFLPPLSFRYIWLPNITPYLALLLARYLRHRQVISGHAAV